MHASSVIGKKITRRRVIVGKDAPGVDQSAGLSDNYRGSSPKIIPKNLPKRMIPFQLQQSFSYPIKNSRMHRYSKQRCISSNTSVLKLVRKEIIPPKRTFFEKLLLAIHKNHTESSSLNTTFRKAHHSYDSKQGNTRVSSNQHTNRLLKSVANPFFSEKNKKSHNINNSSLSSELKPLFVCSTRNRTCVNQKCSLGIMIKDEYCISSNSKFYCANRGDSTTILPNMYLNSTQAHKAPRVMSRQVFSLGTNSRTKTTLENYKNLSNSSKGVFNMHYTPSEKASHLSHIDFFEQAC